MEMAMQSMVHFGKVREIQADMIKSRGRMFQSTWKLMKN
jgi:hypothetical protein